MLSLVKQYESLSSLKCEPQWILCQWWSLFSHFSSKQVFKNCLFKGFKALCLASGSSLCTSTVLFSQTPPYLILKQAKGLFFHSPREASCLDTNIDITVLLQLISEWALASYCIASMFCEKHSFKHWLLQAQDFDILVRFPANSKHKEDTEVATIYFADFSPCAMIH